MSKKNKKREQQSQLTTNQGVCMENTETKVTVKMEAPESPSEKKTQGESTETKTEEKGGIVKLVTAVPSFAWNKAILPAFNFIKGIALRVWNGIVNTYNSEVSAFKELGASQYFLGRGAKIGLMLIKAMIVVAAVAFVNSLLFTYTGISLFNPMTLGIILLVSVVMVAGSSYLAQKETGEISAKVTGQHIVEAFAAA